MLPPPHEMDLKFFASGHELPFELGELRHFPTLNLYLEPQKA